jgi:hypothetical protein
VISAVLRLARVGMPWRPSSTESDAGLIGRVGGWLWHTVDFTGYALDPGSWLWVRPGQVQQWQDLRQAEGTLILFEPDFLDPATAEAVALNDPHAPDGDIAVISLVTDADGDDTGGIDACNAITCGIDLVTHKVVWRLDGFEATAVSDGVVAGIQLPNEGTELEPHYHAWSAKQGGIGLAGRSVANDDVRWTDFRRLTRVDKTRAVAGLLAVEVAVETSRESTMLEVTAGKIPTGMTTGTAVDVASLDCLYDQRSVIVCSDDKEVKAVDAKSHEVLWTISDDNRDRVVPRIDATWHGAVYGMAAANGQYVVLDARTGKDRPGSLELSLALVNEYIGLDISRKAYAATG